MFARVTTVHRSPDEYDQAVSVINDRLMPAARQVPGLVAAYWALDRSSGKGMTFALLRHGRISEGERGASSGTSRANGCRGWRTGRERRELRDRRRGLTGC
jgi:hypothetical protein